MYRQDKRTVITLDAGGTNFVFGAIKANKFIIEPFTLPSNAHCLDACLRQLVIGFERVIQQIEEMALPKPVAISFAFPGPADYSNGVIGGFLVNFPSFREGVALGPFLNHRFGLPVYINNDGDLFAYGEALAGKLPEINEKLMKLGGKKTYRSLIGYTFGTGFGVGHVYNQMLHLGDNSCIETFALRHKDNPNVIVEEGVAARAIQRIYKELTGDPRVLEPKDIFNIAEGQLEGDVKAAVSSFEKLGEIAGDAMATAVSLLDGIVVIGGGIIAASKYIMPALLKEMRSSFTTYSGETVKRVVPAIYNLDDEKEFNDFVKGDTCEIKVYGTDKYVTYERQKRIGVVISSIGANHAISLGAYNYALDQIDRSVKTNFKHKFNKKLY